MFSKPNHPLNYNLPLHTDFTPTTLVFCPHSADTDSSDSTATAAHQKLKSTYGYPPEERDETAHENPQHPYNIGRFRNHPSHMKLTICAVSSLCVIPLPRHQLN